MKSEFHSFISRFTEHPGAIDLFTNGCCFWFAHILAVRFDGTVRYDPVKNHFVAAFYGGEYDITGEVTGEYHTVPWSSYREIDPVHYDRLMAQCVFYI